MNFCSKRFEYNKYNLKFENRRPRQVKVRNLGRELFDLKLRIVYKLYFHFTLLFCSIMVTAQKPVPVRPRILISTDIGGTDPDDNQSMIHFLMYSNRFNTEGLISSPSYG